MATVIMIINYNCTVITIVNYDPKTFIVQATEHQPIEQQMTRHSMVEFLSLIPNFKLAAWKTCQRPKHSDLLSLAIGDKEKMFLNIYWHLGSIL